MTHEVTIHPLARADLFDLYSYIEMKSGRARAGQYIARLQTLCDNLSEMPDRGVDRGDLGVGIRTVALERRALLVYRKTDGAVEILRVLYGGRDFDPDDLSH